MTKARAIKVGDNVRLTGDYLRNTGQATGPEGLSRWIVQAIDEKRGWAVTNQPLEDVSYWTKEELEQDPSLKWRRIALANLEVVGERGRR